MSSFDILFYVTSSQTGKATSSWKYITTKDDDDDDDDKVNATVEVQVTN